MAQGTRLTAQGEGKVSVKEVTGNPGKDYRLKYFYLLSGMKSMAMEFMQYRFPVGGGPSSNICPKCPPHLPQRTSILTIPNEESFRNTVLFLFSCSKKLGQPQVLANLASERNNLLPQAAQ